MTEQWARFYKGVSTTSSARQQAELWVRLRVETGWNTEWKAEAWLAGWCWSSESWKGRLTGAGKEGKQSLERKKDQTFGQKQAAHAQTQPSLAPASPKFSICQFCGCVVQLYSNILSAKFLSCVTWEAPIYPLKSHYSDILSDQLVLNTESSKRFYISHLYYKHTNIHTYIGGGYKSYACTSPWFSDLSMSQTSLKGWLKQVSEPFYSLCITKSEMEPRSVHVPLVLRPHWVCLSSSAVMQL